MSAYPPEAVRAVREALSRHIPLDTFCTDGMAIAALDAVAAATPTTRHHDDGRLSLEWADEPKPGDTVLIRADMLRRLVDRANEGQASMGLVRDAQRQMEAMRRTVLGSHAPLEPSVAPSGASEGGAGVSAPDQAREALCGGCGHTWDHHGPEAGGCIVCVCGVTGAGPGWVDIQTPSGVQRVEIERGEL